ncbi:MAG: inositol-3-phosphate synthase [Gemmatimonadetes bacterium]|nr:inositol-3-phosphate synthase [Gemmatimonadota bacterium]
MGRINVAIIGVGNCASSLIQGIHKYREADPDADIPGLMHTVLGGYHVGDINVVAAFDIDADKVGKDLSEAILSGQNNTVNFYDVPRTGVVVERGMTHDGLGRYLSEVIKKAPGSTADIVGILREREVHVVVNYLPVGSEQATKWYVEQVLAAGCAFVNCIPVFIAREDYWQKRFRDKGLPVVGDDIKSQVGATIVHRVLARLFEDRGVRLDRTYQLNFGGNTDFLNMLERERLMSKKISKTYAVKSQLEREIKTDDVHIGPSDHVPWLHDRKWAYIRLEGTSFGDQPLNIELKLEVHDSPNSAGVGIDAIRCAKLGLDRGLSGTLIGPAAYFMKSPPVQFTDEEARELVEEFIKGDEAEKAVESRLRHGSGAAGA